MFLHHPISVRPNVEIFSDKCSITQIGEKLDIQTMLQRAQLGILDINSFEVPRSSDLPGTFIDPENQDLQNELLISPNESSSIFGNQIEDMQSDVNRLRNIAVPDPVTVSDDSNPDSPS